MHANSPSSYFASLALHGAAALVIFALTFWMTRQPDVPPVIFELVAGPPTQPDATVAGADVPDVKVDLPEIKPFTPPVARPQPEEIPVPPKTEPRQAVKAPPKQEPKKAEPAKMSYDQFVKQHGRPKAPPKTTAAAPIKTPRINTDAITKDLVRSGGGGGTALTRPEADLMDQYLSRLVAAVKLAHERPPGLPEGLEVQVSFTLGANGDITNVRVSHPSGDPEFDRSAVEAFRRVGSIGPPPTRRGDTYTLRWRSVE